MSDPADITPLEIIEMLVFLFSGLTRSTDQRIFPRPERHGRESS
jgi:hypothetical protein